jgi:hypothetical protein
MTIDDNTNNTKINNTINPIHNIDTSISNDMKRIIIFNCKLKHAFIKYSGIPKKYFNTK